MARSARLQKLYRETVEPKLRTDLGLENVMQVPRITKITVNMGVGEGRGRQEGHGRRDRRPREDHRPEAAGHQVERKAVATFKIREGLPVGCKVTLRGARMYEFLDRLINVAMPRIRDFRGVYAALVRRPRQLQLRREGTDHLPGDRSTTRSTRSAAWTSRSRRRRGDDTKVARCSKRSTFRSGSQGPVMAKTSMVEREKRRAKVVKKYAVRRAKLKEADPRPEGVAGRAASRGSCRRCRATRPRRARNRCAITGRSRGMYRKFGLGRVKLREATMRGDVPGLRKASW